MRFLKLQKTGVWQDGRANRTPIIVDAPRKFAPDSARTLTCMSKRKCQLIVGGHDSGKSRWLLRLYQGRRDLFGANAPEPLFLSALHPLSVWCDSPVLEDWYQGYAKTHAANAEIARNLPRKAWTRLTLHQRAELLPVYLEDCKARLFIDDAHKLTGRKCQVARHCLQAASVWLISASSENRLPPSVRTLVDRRAVQITQLQTEASYDSTQVLMWMIAVLCLLGGAWEVSLVLAGLNALGTGRFSARPD